MEGKAGKDIIGTGAVLTTTMEGQRKTMAGGAPGTQRWADRIEADAYAEDAGEAVKKVKQLLGMKVILLTEVALRKKVIALWM